jgi:hypothetical protein
MSKRRHQKRNQSPKKAEPKKTLWDSVRLSLDKNWKLIKLIFMLLTLLAWIYCHFWPAQAKPQPPPRFEIEQPHPSVPVQPANVDEPVSRPA